MVAEAWVNPHERLARYVRPDEFHQAFNFAFLQTPWNAADLRAGIIESLRTNDDRRHRQCGVARCTVTLGEDGGAARSGARTHAAGRAQRGHLDL
jgi:hypothetical protein